VKVLVIGGTGLMGSKVVAKLNDHGHAAIAASPEPGVNTLGRAHRRGRRRGRGHNVIIAAGSDKSELPDGRQTAARRSSTGAIGRWPTRIATYVNPS